MLSLKEAFCTPGSLLQLRETSLCEMCSAAFPAQLSLFMGTGPGRPGRNYLSLGHAWCLAEHTASLLHERDVEGQGDSQSAISLPLQPSSTSPGAGNYGLPSLAPRVQAFLSAGPELRAMTLKFTASDSPARFRCKDGDAPTSVNTQEQAPRRALRKFKTFASIGSH